MNGFGDSGRVRRPLPPHVVVAPDSFKGTMTAREAAHAIAKGVLDACPEAVVTTLPMADGGEGTLAAITSGWEVVEQQTTDALGRLITARWALSPDQRTAVVELAEASGLPAVAGVPWQPLAASTRGTGELLLAALSTGARTIVLCLGGSATTDGGAGILRALGARILDDGGAPVPDGGGGLARVASLDLSGLHPDARTVRWQLAVDVTNPLVGETGSAAVFGPQKGATALDVRHLDDALEQWAGVLAATTGNRTRDLPGAGAAGGVPAGLVAVLGAHIVPGAALVAETLGLPGVLADADLVLTGEGAFDDQSLGGKVVGVLGELAAQSPGHPTVVVLAGCVIVSAARMREAGIAAAYELTSMAGEVDDVRTSSPERLRVLAADIVRRFLRAPPDPSLLSEG